MDTTCPACVIASEDMVATCIFPKGRLKVMVTNYCLDTVGFPLASQNLVT